MHDLCHMFLLSLFGSEELFKNKLTAYDIQWAGSHRRSMVLSPWLHFERGLGRDHGDFYTTALNRISVRGAMIHRRNLYISTRLNIATLAAETNDHSTSRMYRSKTLDLQI